MEWENTQKIGIGLYGIPADMIQHCKMRSMIIRLLLFGLTLAGCREQTRPVSAESMSPDSIPSARPRPLVLSLIPLPQGFTPVPAAAHSFAAWLRRLNLREDKTVRLYDGSVKRNQRAQYAVIDIPTGKKDLQQCADVVMRLRAEYLFSEKKYNEIAFMDYEGKWYKWEGGSNRPAFDQYLEKVFGWCGSASLEKQLTPVPDFNAIKTGDVLVKGGFPGHAVLVADMAVNNKGEKLFLLVQGYQPAQDMHVLVNPNDPSISPWYRIPNTDDVTTPEWEFKKSHLRTW